MWSLCLLLRHLATDANVVIKFKCARPAQSWPEMSVMDATLEQPAWLAAIFRTFGPALQESGQRCFFSLASAQSLSFDTAGALESLSAAAGLKLLPPGSGLFMEVAPLKSTSLQRCLSHHQPAWS